MGEIHSKVREGKGIIVNGRIFYYWCKFTWLKRSSCNMGWS